MHETVDADAAGKAPGRPLRWFLAGAEVITKLWPDCPPGSYACPLCLDLFTVRDLEAKRLTREHVPPASVGGREMVLTCRECNNRAGSTVDAHLERAEALRRFGSNDPLRELDMSLTIAGVTNRGTIHGGLGGVLIVGNPKQNHPDDVATLSEGFAELMEAGHSMQIRFRDTFHPRAAQLGYVRAAYLAAFARFGYSYVLRQSLDWIRAALVDDEDESCVLPVLKRSGGTNRERSIGIVAEPTWLAYAVLVVIGRTAIILPSLRSEDDVIAAFADRSGRCPEDLHGRFRMSPTWEWPREPQYDCDRWLMAQRSKTASANPSVVPPDGVST